MRPKTATRSNMQESLLSHLKQLALHIVSGKENKKIVIFGAGARGIVLHEVLKSFGTTVSFFLDSDKAKQGKKTCGIPVQEPMTIMYENFDKLFVIVAADDPAELTQNLSKFGLELNTHFAVSFDHLTLAHDWESHLRSVPLMDFFLGFNRIWDLPGFEYLGAVPAEKRLIPMELRIITLGGSTTDPSVMDPLEWNDKDEQKECGGWPRCFHQLLNQQNISNSIFNGGLIAYSSAQELLKLLRDGLTLKPDMVVVFDGINDACAPYWLDFKYPRTHSYFKVLEGAFQTQLKNCTENIAGYTKNSNVEGICHGLETTTPIVEEWYANQRMMKAICDEFDIEYISFLQPAGVHLEAFQKSSDIEYRVNYFLWNFLSVWGPDIHKSANDCYTTQGIDLNQMVSDYLLAVFEDSFPEKGGFRVKNPCIRDFYKDAQEMVKTCDYIIDIVDVFDGYSDIIYDNCHCTQEGNQLLAERIYQEITHRDLFQKVMKKVTKRYSC